MSDPRVPENAVSEDDGPRTIVYDPTDPFWQDTEEDDDDMEYMPAPGDSDEEEEEDDDGEIDFHGTFYKCCC